MNRFIYLSLLLFLQFSASCTENGPIEDDVNDMEGWVEYKDEKKYETSQELLALKGQTPKILVIGNSFEVDATTFLPEIIKANNIQDIIIERLYLGGSKIDDNIRSLENNVNVYDSYVRYEKDNWKDQKLCSLVDVLKKEKWNIIILKEHVVNYFDYANLISKIEYYQKLIVSILGYRPCFVFATPWAYSNGYEVLYFDWFNNSEFVMYNVISRTVHDYIMPSGLFTDFIPNYSVIQNARNTSLNNPPLRFTRDGYHADYGAGRWLLAYTFFNRLIAPLYDININDVKLIDVNEGNFKMTSTVKELLYDCVVDGLNYPYVINRTYE